MPLRYRVLVIPGSGCMDMQSMADRYFAGLLHAEVLVLQKPWMDPGRAERVATDCPAEFQQKDNLSDWFLAARSALRSDALRRLDQPVVPQLLVGISEGAELLTALAPEVPHLAGLVLLSGSGLDPVEAGAMQARRLGQWPAWQRLDAAQRSRQSDAITVEGRSLRYWRTLWEWRYSQTLIDSRWPILQVWGEQDTLVPAQAFSTFAQRARGRSAPWCSFRFADADHGLQSPSNDGVQRLWSWLDRWGREPSANPCDALPTGVPD